MRYLIFLVLFSLACQKENGVQPTTSSLYFPPVNSTVWETTTPESLNWNAAQLSDLYSFLEKNNTKAFLILKDGKIVVEKYFGTNLSGGTFTQNSNWYWASAAKTLTSFMVGKALEDGFLKLEDRTSTYLGKWTSLTAAQENAITIKHQITMTTGLNDSGDKDCTKPECLTFTAAPNTRWAYHNAPYTLLDKVVENAAKQSFDTYFDNKLKSKIGMDGFWNYMNYNHLYFSTPRAMARFGLLMLNKGKWQNETIMKQEGFFTEMTNTSQNINLSYGYLWWLNGKQSFMVPSLQTVFPRNLSTTAPADMFAAMGKNGQLLNIVPSQNLIVVRMGDNPDNSLVPFTFQDDMWAKINTIIK